MSMTLSRIRHFAYSAPIRLAIARSFARAIRAAARILAFRAWESLLSRRASPRSLRDARRTLARSRNCCFFTPFCTRRESVRNLLRISRARARMRIAASLDLIQFLARVVADRNLRALSRISARARSCRALSAR